MGHHPLFPDTTGTMLKFNDGNNGYGLKNVTCKQTFNGEKHALSTEALELRNWETPPQKTNKQKKPRKTLALNWAAIRLEHSATVVSFHTLVTTRE